MEPFVDKHSIVRQIWGKSDTILVIFAGAAAEFALSKAVDWLYFTGRLPSDPLGRLFSTVAYARAIVFSDQPAAMRAIDTITAIHKGVESERGSVIPDWAYRSVLYMLIDYSIRSFELLERPLSLAEKREAFDVFSRVGERMGIPDLPRTLEEWEQMREKQLQQDLQKSHYTDNLFRQYRRHLGWVRYRLLVETQILVVPDKVGDWLGFRKYSFLQLIIPLYKLSRLIQLDYWVKAIVFPSVYRKKILELDRT